MTASDCASRRMRRSRGTGLCHVIAAKQQTADPSRIQQETGKDWTGKTDRGDRGDRVMDSRNRRDGIESKDFRLDSCCEGTIRGTFLKYRQIAQQPHRGWSEALPLSACYGWYHDRFLE